MVMPAFQSTKRRHEEEENESARKRASTTCTMSSAGEFLVEEAWMAQWCLT